LAIRSSSAATFTRCQNTASLLSGGLLAWPTSTSTGAGMCMGSSLARAASSRVSKIAASRLRVSRRNTAPVSSTWIASGTRPRSTLPGAVKSKVLGEECGTPRHCGRAARAHSRRGLG
jgi:hypothetical protein